VDELLDILSTGHGEQLNPEFLLWANPCLAPSKLRLDHTHLAQTLLDLAHREIQEKARVGRMGQRRTLIIVHEPVEPAFVPLELA
jgi:hypothetical protein